MTFLHSLALAMSGALIMASIMMPVVGLERKTWTRREAGVFCGVGVALGAGPFIYFGIGNGNLLDAILVGLVTGLFLGLVLPLSRGRL